MPDKNQSGRGGSRKGAGRPPKGETPMHRSAFTAPVEQIVFFLIAGDENAVSAGVQKAAEFFSADDENKTGMGVYYRQALFVVSKVKGVLGEDADPKDIVQYARNNYKAILAEFDGTD